MINKITLEEISEMSSPLSSLVVIGEYFNLIEQRIKDGYHVPVYNTKLDNVPLNVLESIEEFNEFKSKYIVD